MLVNDVLSTNFLTSGFERFLVFHCSYFFFSFFQTAYSSSQLCFCLQFAHFNDILQIMCSPILPQFLHVGGLVHLSL